MSKPLHLKERPTSFDQVVGHENIIKNLRKVLEKDPPHTFLFTGPSGSGKTTLGRIVARVLEIGGPDLFEVDGATYTGIDSMRGLKEATQFRGMYSKNARRMLLIDECHALSKAAWQSLLKIVEEPPPHLYFVFCTTEGDKVPTTIVSRCTAYSLSELDYDEVVQLVQRVNAKNDLGVEKKVLHVVAQEAYGNARQALVYLDMVKHCKDADSAREVIARVSGSTAEAIDFARLVCSGRVQWNTAMKVLSKIEKAQAESIRITVVNYAAAIMRTSNKPKQIMYLASVIDCFTERRYNQSDKLAPLLLSLAQLLYAE